MDAGGVQQSSGLRSDDLEDKVAAGLVENTSKLVEDLKFRQRKLTVRSEDWTVLLGDGAGGVGDQRSDGGGLGDLQGGFSRGNGLEGRRG